MRLISSVVSLYDKEDYIDIFYEEIVDVIDFKIIMKNLFLLMMGVLTSLLSSCANYMPRIPESGS